MTLGGLWSSASAVASTREDSFSLFANGAMGDTTPEGVVLAGAGGNGTANGDGSMGEESS